MLFVRLLNFLNSKLQFWKPRYLRYDLYLYLPRELMLWNRLIGLEMTFGLEGLSLMSLAWLIELGWEDWFVIWLFEMVFAFPPIGSSSAVSKFDWFVAGFALLLSNKSIEPDRLYTVSQGKNLIDHILDQRFPYGVDRTTIICRHETITVRQSWFSSNFSCQNWWDWSHIEHSNSLCYFRFWHFGGKLRTFERKRKFDFQGLVWNWRFSRRACRPWRSEYLTFWVLNDFAFDQAKTYNNKLK